MPSKIRKRRQNSYEFNVSGGHDNFGKQIMYSDTFQFANMTEAKAAYILYDAECKKGKVMSTTTQRMTLAEFYAYWKKHYSDGNLSAATKSANDYLSSRLLACLGYIRIYKINKKHMLEFLSQLRAPDAGMNNKPLSGATVQKHFHLLKELLTYAVKWDFIAVNPADKIDTPKRDKQAKQLPAQEEFSAFFSAVMAKATLKQKLWVLMAFDMGMRREEIFGLKIGDIDFAKRLLRITRAAIYTAGAGIVIKDAKTVNSVRTLGISPMTFDTLQEYILEEKRQGKKAVDNIVPFAAPLPADRWLFVQPGGSVGHPYAFNNFLKRFCKSHNFFAISPHLLRHLSGSYLLNYGVDLATVSNMLGHKQKSFTANTYIHAIQSVDPRVSNTMQSIMTNILEKEKEKSQA